MFVPGLARVHAGSVLGLRAHRVRVEVDLAPALPGFHLVGLPDAAVRESRERIGAALRHAGFHWPDRRVTVSLAPADLRKEGAPLDLAIAVALLLADGQLGRPAAGWLEKTLWCGELALDGSLRPARGALALALDARELGLERVVLPVAQQQLAARLPGATVLPLAHLRALPTLLARPPSKGPSRASLPAVGTVEDPPALRGQLLARRAITVAAAGGHHLYLEGPPGCGKTLLARWLAALLPPLGISAWRERLRILGSLEATVDPVAARRPPLRAPHSSVGMAGLLGGGNALRPGEITLAHRGVLFLDEAPEFGRARLDALRPVMESGQIHLARARGGATFPARFQLVAAGNPCPCGFAHRGAPACRCEGGAIDRYQRRLSGPLRDRFDLWVAVEREEARTLFEGEVWDVEAARRAILRVRRLAPRRGCLNARLGGAALFAACALGDADESLAREWADRSGVGPRGIQAALRVARTLADLDEAEMVGRSHLLEALQWAPRGESSSRAG